jgi:uncharacterized protein YjbI with pentapeptide repeats
MFRSRRRQKLTRPLSISDPEKKLQREPSCLTWKDVALGALIPLMIGVSTIVITLVIQRSEDKRRDQENDLAFLRRLQDQRLADELYYQGVFKTYVEDVSNVLFKSNNSFVDNEKKMKYIRTKTLTALDELDWKRKSRLFLFLNETGLLSPYPLSSPNDNTTNVSLDLSGANFVNISIESTAYKKLHFNNLNLSSVDLTNASFIGCQFNQGADFSYSNMLGANFTRSKFECSKEYKGANDTLGKIHVKFKDSNLERSDFSDSYICDISFARANLAYSIINRIAFQGLIEFLGTNLTKVNWDRPLDHSHYFVPLFLNFSNIDFRTTPLEMEWFHMPLVRYEVNNVIFFNETWKVSESNLILNGNAETNVSFFSRLLRKTIVIMEDIINSFYVFLFKCQSLLDEYCPANWGFFSSEVASRPMLSNYPQMENASYGNYSFNFTVSDKSVGMQQQVDVDDYSIFIDTSEAEYKFSADVRCVKGYVIISVDFYNEASVPPNDPGKDFF